MHARLAILILLGAQFACSLQVPEFKATDGGTNSSSPPPKITAFDVVPSALPPGAKAKLSWTVEDATRVSIAAIPGGAVIDDSSTLSGMADSAPLEAATTFELTAVGPGGMSQAVHLVTIDPSALAVIEFGARPNPGARDSNAEIVWRTAGASSVVIKHGDATFYTAPIAEVEQGAILSAVLAEASESYTLEISNGVDTKTAPLALASEPPPVIEDFQSSPPSFTASPADVELSWHVRDATAIKLLENGWEVEGFTFTGVDRVMRHIDRTAVFDLIASSGGGVVTKRISPALLATGFEPNNDTGTANWITGGAITEEISPAGDVDYFAIMLGWNVSLYATVQNADGTCPFPSVLTLYNENHERLAEISRDRNPGPPSDCPAFDPVHFGFPVDLELGVYYLSVGALDGRTGAYTLIASPSTPRCGDGVVQRGEHCDDTNHTAGDNCSPSCRYEPATTFSGAGGTTVLNLTRYDPRTSSYYRWIAVDLVTAGESIEVHTSDPGGGGCTLDTQLQISDDGYVFVYEPADETLHGCAEVAFPGNSRAVGLPPGIYDVRVANRNPDAAVRVEVAVTIHEPACGNFAVEPGEQCDDGNIARGDGCNAICEIEPFGEVRGPPSDNTFPHTIHAEGQLDLYQVTLTEPGYVAVETQPCADQGFDTRAYLFDSTFYEIQTHDDDLPILCAHLDPWIGTLLPPGRYWVGIDGFAPFPIDYQVHIRTFGISCGNGIAESVAHEECDDANQVPTDGCDACDFLGAPDVDESEPNDVFADANRLAIAEGETRIVHGTIEEPIFYNGPQVAGDLFKLDIGPTLANVRAITHTVIGVPGQCDPPYDTNLKILNSAGAEVANHDDIVPSTCSLIETTLAPGTYYFLVQGWNDVIPDYFLTIELQ